MIWLLNRAGLRLPISTLLAAALLLATSLAECWLPGRSAEITDAVMALVLGGVFAVLREMERTMAPQSARPEIASASSSGLLPDFLPISSQGGKPPGSEGR